MHLNNNNDNWGFYMYILLRYHISQCLVNISTIYHLTQEISTNRFINRNSDVRLLMSVCLSIFPSVVCVCMSVTVYIITQKLIDQST